MTQTSINIVVAFGNAEDSYYVGAGRRFAVQNMLQSLVDCVQGSELPISRLGWLRSVSSTGSLAFSQIDGGLFQCQQYRRTMVRGELCLREKLVSSNAHNRN